VAIQRLIREASFGPDDIRRLTAEDRQDPVTELIAGKIIQVYRLGEQDPPRICARALKELGVPIPEN
jgi:hypothetical protein